MKIVYLSAVLAALAGPAYAQTQQNSAESTAERAATSEISAQEFVTTAGVSNMFEIQTSQLAVQKAESADVRQFAEQMIADHTRAGSELEAIVGQDTSAGLEIPAQLDDKHAAKLEQLQSASGPDFDRSYKTMQVEAHQEAVQLFQSYSEQGENTELRSWASQTLPTLQAHLEHAQNMQTGQQTGSLQ